MKRWWVLVALGAAGCSDPVDALRDEVAALSGAAPVLCGGARIDAPDDAVDNDCVDAAAESAQPYEVWGEPHYDEAGDPVFHGIMVFDVGGTARWYNLTDGRADEGGLVVERCALDGDEPRCDQECVDGC